MKNKIKKNNKKKILMLAWRDMDNPSKGGAEIVTDIYLKGLVNHGHDVTMFTSMYKGAKKQEKYNGYKIKRKGNKLSVYLHGLIFATKNKDRFDFIIDQVNTIPFFTPLTIPKKKRIAFFHQLCLNVWFYEAPFPVSIIGNILERSYLKLYLNTRSFVVSNSTKDDLIKYAWNKKDDILVLDNQIDFQPIKFPTKKENHFVFCGRLKKSKRVHDCIKAMSMIKNKSTKLYIIGDGDIDYRRYLEKLSRRLGLTERVIFTGHISKDERNYLMRSSIGILVTSVREGWGLIVTEANANGTLAITYDIEGLRDANDSGFITKKNSPKYLAYLMDILNIDKVLLTKLSHDALNSSNKYHDWNKNCRELEKWIKK